MPGSNTTDLTIARVAALSLPLAFLASRAGSEILIGAIDALFVAHCLRSPVRLSFRSVIVATSLWWAWTILVSAFRLPADGPHAVIQAIVLGRFFVLAASLALWILPQPTPRRAMAFMVMAAALFIGIECWQQMLTGADLFGWQRWGDGALTGPFRGPKAGPVLVLILFPAMVAPVAALLARRNVLASGTAWAIAALSVATMVLIGQRMPALLTLLGLGVCGLFLRRLRPLLVATVAAGVAVLAATPLISPPTFAKLVIHFRDQMGHFRESPYGLIYTRAAVMTLAHPWLGLGFDGFRTHCYEPAYAHPLPGALASLGTPAPLASDPGGCNIHPHNHYLEAATAGGFPGLALFAAMVLAWLVALGRHLSAPANGLRVGLFAAVLIAIWPFASTSAFATLPNAGWLFLLLGWGLACAQTDG